MFPTRDKAVTDASSSDLGQLQLIKSLGTGDAGHDGKDRSCLDDTRVNVLSQIIQWIEDESPDAKRVRWLTAPAGTGKSAVAASVEKHLRDTHQLGAVFYFVREQPERNSRAIVEIGRQLAFHDAVLRNKICENVTKDPDIAMKPRREQYLRLIQQPLQEVLRNHAKIVIVVDALDECDEVYMKDLLHLIGGSLANLSPAVKFFFSSRIDTHIKAKLDSPEFETATSHQPLQEEDMETVTRDIKAYLKYYLPRAVRELGIDEDGWPGPATREALARMASGLFIWASTVVLVIADPDSRDPEGQLKHVLDSPSLTHLDTLYFAILDRAFPMKVKASIMDLLMAVLGALVVAQEPLTVTTLSRLLSLILNQPLLPEEVQRKVLGYLHSVLIVPGQSNGTIRVMHKSFVDFLAALPDDSTAAPSSSHRSPVNQLAATEQSRHRFRIIAPEHHRSMALACLRCMESLKLNICALDAAKLNTEVGDLEDRIQSCIPLDLQYSCKHCAAHILAAEDTDGIVYHAVLRFADHRLMFWLEAMSLLGLAGEALHVARLLEHWAGVRQLILTNFPS